jgi:hypothetical protein
VLNLWIGLTPGSAFAEAFVAAVKRFVDEDVRGGAVPESKPFPRCRSEREVGREQDGRPVIQ